MEANNITAMREALVQCELFLSNVSRHGHPMLNPGDKCTACDGVEELRGMVVQALAAPPRNCEVGTPAEQAERFHEFCHSHKTFYAECSEKCPFRNAPDINCCQAGWGQLPYKKEGEA